MKFFAIDEGQLAALKKLAARFHTEDRMDGDEMRDMGHALAGIAQVAEQLEIPE